MVDRRLSAEERREAILQAALTVFSHKGFNGATTKDIAAEAGVSEALLYRHFPSKEELHEALHSMLCSNKDNILSHFLDAAPSTKLLVQMHFLFVNLISGGTDDPMGEAVPRLLFQNMLEDGAFARLFHEQRFYCLFPAYKASLEAAIAAGDVQDKGLNEQECLWFTHHLAVMFRMNSMPATPIYEYKKNHHALLNDAIAFTLRGIGMTESAIQTYYQPDTLAKELAPLLQPQHTASVSS